MEKIYLDNAATTKPDVQSLDKAVAYYKNNYFNPSAKNRDSVEIAKVLSQAKNDVLLSFNGYDAVFTSCGTEADNMAIFGFFKRKNAVTTLGEHSAVYNSFIELQNKGFEVRFAELNADGSVNREDFLSLVDENTTFCSVVHVNNETGAVNDINTLAKLAKQKSKRLIFHSDGVQAYQKIDYKLDGNVDLYSVSAHKIGAVKGVGALIFKRGLTVPPYIIGGGQQEGLRSGTENVLGILDFAFCAEKFRNNFKNNLQNAEKLKLLFLENLKGGKVISSDNGSPYIVSLSFKDLRGQVIMNMLDDENIIVGTGSACSSRRPHSRVLKNVGLSKGELDGVIRVSFGFDTTCEEVLYAVDKINNITEKLYNVLYKK
ncbi:MAG: cysteine desulfurase family protein [Christensenellaceae bacterium]